MVKNGPDNAAHGICKCYYGQSGENSWYELSKELARTREPTAYTKEELVKYFGSEVRASASV